MGGQVLTTVIEWAIEALREHPVLVAPTLLLALGVFIFAVCEALTLTVEIGTIMVRHFRNRIRELKDALRELSDAITQKLKADQKHGADIELIRPRSIQRERLSQQQLFDKGTAARKSDGA